ncbi:MAG: DUF554 domain-containing protein [Ruminococcaceae bacterium]|nr:DUF554 domain-containing protein [Oscillospiraceae bacterium]
MIAVFVNTATVLIGSIIGLIFSGKIKEERTNALVTGLALITILIGVQSAIQTANVLCVIICMVVGIIVGEACRIDDGIEGAGDWLKRKVLRGKSSTNGRFSEGFVSACILFCVGSMTIMGSIEAGINHDYSIIFAKSALDLISSMAFAAAMGVGVVFSAAFVLVFQGALTLLATQLGGFLTAEMVTEMSAVGGVILIGMAINMLGLRKERIKVANMLPAIFLPVAFVPLYDWIVGLL